MEVNHMHPSKMLVSVTLASLFALLILMLMIFPAHVLNAALQGVGIWWDVLFPALFPFFIIAELLLSFGIVHFFGTLLDPLMRPLFRVPGIGGFVMAMGFASGYPVGARLTAQLWEQKLINRTEGERLVAFTSTSDPIFLIGAVAVGFFFNPGLALILAIAHYGAGVIVGIFMRFHAGSAPMTPSSLSKEGGLLQLALRNMHDARLAVDRPIGHMLRDAVTTALRLIFVVGGLVVFFSVLIEILSISGILQVLTSLVSSLLELVGLPPQLAPAFMNGLFEVTLGSQSAGSAEGPLLIHKAAAAAFVLSWAGLSVHAQIVSLMSATGMRYLPFLAARFMHAVLATFIVLGLWDVVMGQAAVANAWLQSLVPEALVDSSPALSGKWLYIPLSIGVLSFVVLTVASLFVHAGKKLISRFTQDKITTTFTD